jgi:hypothetical protein
VKNERMNNMLNRLYDAIEQVLESIDVGGEQSRQFAEEIKILKEVIGYPEPDDGVFDEVQRRRNLTEKMRRLSVEAKGLKMSLPKLPLEKWFDGTIQDSTIDVFFEEYDMAKVLRFIADVGIEQ